MWKGRTMISGWVDISEKRTCDYPAKADGLACVPRRSDRHRPRHYRRTRRFLPQNQIEPLHKLIDLHMLCRRVRRVDRAGTEQQRIFPTT